MTGRCTEANAWGADYFISIHRDAFKPEQAQGVTAYVYSKCKKGGETYNKAKTIVDDVCEATGFKNRGVILGAPSYTDFAVNRVTKMDSCLLECVDCAVWINTTFETEACISRKTVTASGFTY